MTIAAIESVHLDIGANEPSMSWNCAFCEKLRIYEGGRPFDFGHLDTCTRCESRVAATLADRATVAAMIDKHLL